MRKQKPYNVSGTCGGAFGRMGEKKRMRGERKGKGLGEVRNKRWAKGEAMRGRVKSSR